MSSKMVYPKKYMFNNTRHGSKVKRSDTENRRNVGSHNGQARLGRGHFGFKVPSVKSELSLEDEAKKEISKSENLHRTSASDSSETLDPDKSKSTHRSPEKKNREVSNFLQNQIPVFNVNNDESSLQANPSKDASHCLNSDSCLDVQNLPKARKNSRDKDSNSESLITREPHQTAKSQMCNSNIQNIEDFTSKKPAKTSESDQPVCTKESNKSSPSEILQKTKIKTVHDDLANNSTSGSENASHPKFSRKIIKKAADPGVGKISCPVTAMTNVLKSESKVSGDLTTNCTNEQNDSAVLILMSADEDSMENASLSTRYFNKLETRPITASSFYPGSPELSLEEISMEAMPSPASAFQDCFAEDFTVRDSLASGFQELGLVDTVQSSKDSLTSGGQELRSADFFQVNPDTVHSELQLNRTRQSETIQMSERPTKVIEPEDPAFSDELSDFGASAYEAVQASDFKVNTPEAVHTSDVKHATHKFAQTSDFEATTSEAATAVVFEDTNNEVAQTLDFEAEAAQTSGSKASTPEAVLTLVVEDTTNEVAPMSDSEVTAHENVQSHGLSDSLTLEKIGNSYEHQELVQHQDLAHRDQPKDVRETARGQSSSLTGHVEVFDSAKESGDVTIPCLLCSFKTTLTSLLHKHIVTSHADIFVRKVIPPSKVDLLKANRILKPVLRGHKCSVVGCDFRTTNLNPYLMDHVSNPPDNCKKLRQLQFGPISNHAGTAEIAAHKKTSRYYSCCYCNYQCKTTKQLHRHTTGNHKQILPTLTPSTTPSATTKKINNKPLPNNNVTPRESPSVTKKNDKIMLISSSDSTAVGTVPVSTPFKDLTLDYLDTSAKQQCNKSAVVIPINTFKQVSNVNMKEHKAHIIPHFEVTKQQHSQETGSRNQRKLSAVTKSEIIKGSILSETGATMLKRRKRKPTEKALQYSPTRALFSVAPQHLEETFSQVTQSADALDMSKPQRKKRKRENVFNSKLSPEKDPNVARVLIQGQSSSLKVASVETSRSLELGLRDRPLKARAFECETISTELDVNSAQNFQANNENSSQIVDKNPSKTTCKNPSQISDENPSQIVNEKGISINNKEKMSFANSFTIKEVEVIMRGSSATPPNPNGNQNVIKVPQPVAVILERRDPADFRSNLPGEPSQDVTKTSTLFEPRSPFAPNVEQLQKNNDSDQVCDVTSDRACHSIAKPGCISPPTVEQLQKNDSDDVTMPCVSDKACHSIEKPGCESPPTVRMPSPMEQLPNPGEQISSPDDGERESRDENSICFDNEQETEVVVAQRSDLGQIIRAFKETAGRANYTCHRDKSVYVSDGESSEKLQSAVDDSDDSQSSSSQNSKPDTDPPNSSAHTDDVHMCTEVMSQAVMVLEASLRTPGSEELQQQQSLEHLQQQQPDLRCNDIVNSNQVTECSKVPNPVCEVRANKSSWLEMKCQEYESIDVTDSFDVTAEEMLKHVDILEEDSSRVDLHVSDQFLECILDDEPDHSELDSVAQRSEQVQPGLVNPDLTEPEQSFAKATQQSVLKQSVQKTENCLSKQAGPEHLPPDNEKSLTLQKDSSGSKSLISARCSTGTRLETKHSALEQLMAAYVDNDSSSLVESLPKMHPQSEFEISPKIHPAQELHILTDRVQTCQVQKSLKESKENGIRNLEQPLPRSTNFVNSITEKNEHGEFRTISLDCPSPAQDISTESSHAISFNTNHKRKFLRSTGSPNITTSVEKTKNLFTCANQYQNDEIDISTGKSNVIESESLNDKVKKDISTNTLQASKNHVVSSPNSDSSCKPHVQNTDVLSPNVHEADVHVQNFSEENGRVPNGQAVSFQSVCKENVTVLDVHESDVHDSSTSKISLTKALNVDELSHSSEISHYKDKGLTLDISGSDISNETFGKKVTCKNVEQSNNTSLPRDISTNAIEKTFERSPRAQSLLKFNKLALGSDNSKADGSNDKANSNQTSLQTDSGTTNISNPKSTLKVLVQTDISILSTLIMSAQTDISNSNCGVAFTVMSEKEASQSEDDLDMTVVVEPDPIPTNTSNRQIVEVEKSAVANNDLVCGTATADSVEIVEEEPVSLLENFGRVPHKNASHPVIVRLFSTPAKGLKRKCCDDKTLTAATDSAPNNKSRKGVFETWESVEQQTPDNDDSEQSASTYKRPLKRKLNNNIGNSPTKRRRENLLNKNTEKTNFKQQKLSRQKTSERLAEIFGTKQSQPYVNTSFAPILYSAAMNLLRPQFRGKSCPFCCFKTTIESSFTEHLATPHNAVSSVDELANLDVDVFMSQSSTQEITRTTSKAISPITDYVGVDLTDIEQYEKGNSVDFEQKCSLCSFSDQDEQVVQRHAQSVHGLVSESLQMCSFKSLSKTKLRRQTQIHSVQSEWMNDIQEYSEQVSLAGQASLVEEATVTVMLPYQSPTSAETVYVLKEIKCKSCDFSSQLTSLLELHNKNEHGHELEERNSNHHIHSQLNSFVCPRCKEWWNSIDSWRSHIKEKHLPKSGNVFECIYCSKILGSTKSCLGHMEVGHLRFFKFQCSFPGCQKRFSTKPAVQRHAITHAED